MKLFKWSKGRQKATESIQKMTLWIGKTFDVYLLRIPHYSIVGWHYDKVPQKEHHRLNITLWGSYIFCRKHGQFSCKERESIYADLYQEGNWIKFRPDIEEHMVISTEKALILSIGWIK